ncbi:STAS domain-containing protein [Oscillatoria sp. FACHB-1406]|uniref:anti-sigma factor antagonist n=1 Tax=Oscillatoria sp. FACHB-1406 TaxID=2692846 RepID=UPI001684FBDE|nr:STAS domain-containing protein [Oscillatoria sp. FACHB-1406]
MTHSIVSEKIATIELFGSITAVNAEELRGQLMKKLAKPALSVLQLDLSKVEFLDSAGLMTLVTAYRLANSLNKRLIFCSVPPAVRIVFELTQLDRTFDMFEDRLAGEFSVIE